MPAIPRNLQGVLWSKDVKNLDLESDKNYIIHQVLMYGSLKQIKWLRSVYKNKVIKEIFTKEPRKVYTPAAFNFAKNYLLEINTPLQKENYVKAVF